MTGIATAAFAIKAQYAGAIRWSRRGSCTERGCTDPECCCSVCGLPIGVAEEDPRWDSHGEHCAGCALCEDEMPIMLFRGKGKEMEQAQFHNKCFRKIIHIRSRAGA